MHTVAYVHAVTGLHDLTDLIVNYLCVRPDLSPAKSVWRP